MKNTSPINLNSATADELRSLPGVGPALARAILSDRGAAGEYASVEDLRRVPGVGPKLLARIVGLVAVAGVAVGGGILPAKAAPSAANDDRTPTAPTPAAKPTAGSRVFAAADDIRHPPGMRWTDGQIEAIRAIRQHLRSKAGTIYLLKGYAGTGKTSLLTEALRGFASPVMIAPTHKAKSILEPKAEQLGGTADTAHRWLGYRKVLDEETATTSFVRVPKDPKYKHPKWKPLIIDEISMLNAQMWAEIVAEVQREGLMCIAMGDPLQLPPVGEDISPAFAAALPSSELTQVMRSTGVLTEAVLHVRSHIQDHIPPMVRQSAEEGGSAVEHWTDKKGFLRDYLARIQAGECAVILAWTNDIVDWCNQTLRRWIAGASPDPYVPGEVLVVTESYSLDHLVDDEEYLSLSTMPMLYSETRLRVISAEKVRHPEWGDWCWALRVAELGFGAHVVNDAGVRDESASMVWGPVYALDAGQLKAVRRRRAEMADDFNQAKQIAKGNGDLAQRAKQRQSELAKQKVQHEAAYIYVRPGYATTVHKSQGSTWQNVYVLQGDIAKNGRDYERNRLLYVAFSRAAKRLAVYG